MLIQSLVIIVAMVVLSGAILTSTLVTAKASLHQTLIAKTQTAMQDATAAFVSAAAADVRKYGTEQPWPSSTPTSQAMCAGPSSAASASPCPFLAVASWRVTGRTSVAPVSLPSPASPSASASASATSDAQNLAATIDEQRVSVTIAVRITDPTGRTLLADRSRELTARIFNASPYVVITGSRDSTTAAGSIHAAEGDTAGISPELYAGPGQIRSSPNPLVPAAFVRTTLLASIDCVNSSKHFDQGNAASSTDYGTFVDHSIRPFGNQDWAYEAPCTPKFSIDGSEAPPGYNSPSVNVYISIPTNTDTEWLKHDSNASSFAR